MLSLEAEFGRGEKLLPDERANSRRLLLDGGGGGGSFPVVVVEVELPFFPPRERAGMAMSNWHLAFIHDFFSRFFFSFYN